MIARPGTVASERMMSSARPSAKSAWSGLSTAWAKGSTAMPGCSSWVGWRAGASAPAAGAGTGAGTRCAPAGPVPVDTLKVLTGSAMFLTRCSPWASKRASVRPWTVLRTDSETVTPPASARPCSRAAMLTPSPYTLPSAFSITSPRCTPMRKCRRRSSGASAPGMPARRPWTASAAFTAAVALSNTASTESPAMSTTRPACVAISELNTARAASNAATVPWSSIAIRRE